MGLSYTVCYCKDGYKCKGHAHEQDKFDDKHWNEVRDNLRGYLNEPICVPSGQADESLPPPIVNAAKSFVSALKNCREDHLSADYKTWHGKRLDCFRLLAQLNTIPVSLVDSLDLNDDPAIQLSTTTTPDKDDVSNSVVEMAEVLAESYTRAVLELIQSLRGEDPVYVYHHLGLVMDIVAEMHAIVIQATAHVSTENMFPEDHRYQELIEERRKADGISGA